MREQNDVSVMQQKKKIYRMFNKKERELSKYWSFLDASFTHELRISQSEHFLVIFWILANLP